MAYTNPTVTDSLTKRNQMCCITLHSPCEWQNHCACMRSITFFSPPNMSTIVIAFLSKRLEGNHIKEQ